jgi:hypothetical protein
MNLEFRIALAQSGTLEVPFTLFRLISKAVITRFTVVTKRFHMKSLTAFEIKGLRSKYCLKRESKD